MPVVTKPPISVKTKTKKAYFEQLLLNCLIFENIIQIFSQKISNQTIQPCFSIFNGNRYTLPLKILTYFKLY